MLSIRIVNIYSLEILRLRTIFVPKDETLNAKKKTHTESIAMYFYPLILQFQANQQHTFPINQKLYLDRIVQYCSPMQTNGFRYLDK